MRKPIFILITVSCLICFASDAFGFWIWTPKTNKFVNPKHAAKDTPEEQYKWAMKLYEKKDYKRAAEEFISLTVHFKESDLAPDALYYAGRAYEKMNKSYPAFETYQKVSVIYPYTERIDEIIERQYDLAQVVYKKHEGLLMGREIMTDLDRAVEMFKMVKKNSPFGEYAEKAQFMVGECYKKGEQYNEAIDAFHNLVDDYPKSELVEKARYEIAQCTYLASLRPDYDQELTDEAIKEFKKIADSGNQEGDIVAEDAKLAVAFLEDRKAESLFKTARFYEGQKHYGSAEIYYKELLKKYPESTLGALATERISKIEKPLKKERARNAAEKNKKPKKWIFF